ncbi:MAG: ribosome silencing factor [Clostridia bacterium]|nr:ribosome silencing factor [Clostridia bacterium]
MNDKVKLICKTLSDKKAVDIKVVQVKEISSLADYFVICSGKNAPQVKALYDNLDETLSKQGIEPRRQEGSSEGKWIAIDYGDVLVHIFHSDTREFYQLDKLWSNGMNVVDYKE